MSRKKKLSTGLPVKPLAGPQIEEKLISDIKEINKVTEENCINCRFHIPGKCRRFPPTMGNRYSEVKLFDWCGEWRSKCS